MVNKTNQKLYVITRTRDIDRRTYQTISLTFVTIKGSNNPPYGSSIVSVEAVVLELAGPCES